jgi:hypothetical protein
MLEIVRKYAINKGTDKTFGKMVFMENTGSFGNLHCEDAWSKAKGITINDETVISSRILKYEEIDKNKAVFIFARSQVREKFFARPEINIAFNGEVFHSSYFQSFTSELSIEECKRITIETTTFSFKTTKKEVLTVNLKFRKNEMNIFFEIKEGKLIEIDYDLPCNYKKGRLNIIESYEEAEFGW